MFRKTCCSIASVALIPMISIAASAQPPADSAHTVALQQSAGSAMWSPQILGTQINVIGQRLAPFHSPYSGANSLQAAGDHALSHVYGAYVGAVPFAWGADEARQVRVESYLDVEMSRGHGVSNATGLAGVTNGDVLRAGTADLGNGPYVARLFLRIIAPLGRGAEIDTLARGADQIGRAVSASRFEITAGKFAASDLFDLNRYANSARSQFMNWALFQNTAWDFAADTRGYTNGVAVAFVSRHMSLRFGSFQMPTQANGNKFDSDLRWARGDNVELTVIPSGGHAPVLRLLAYRNHARMGSYAAALAEAAVVGGRPDIVADDRPGRSKSGWGINIEQPVADLGETGFFARLGSSDGANESFAFTEVDRHVSVGFQASGGHWARPDDRVGAAFVRHDIATIHQQYLSAGGVGFLLGDGRLTYGAEQIVEAYYRVQLGSRIEMSPDIQLIRNPGYNRDRGPAKIVGMRLNFQY